MHLGFKGDHIFPIRIDKMSIATLSGDLVYVNHDVLNYMACAKFDPDGYEYACDLFDLARDPALFDKLLSL